MCPKVTVCIVTWNSAKDLPACLNALAQQDFVNIECLVVDNASKDDSLLFVKEKYPQTHIISNRENHGFCGGHNQGIAASSGAYYLPLNPDVVMEPDYISQAVAAMESASDVGMVATRLYLGQKGDLPRRIDSTGLFIDRTRRQYLRGFGELADGRYCEMEEVFGVDGAAPLYRRAMLEEIKIDGQCFDESFFAHKEDVDLSWRARIMGWRCIYTPDAVAYHMRTFRPGQKIRKVIADEVKLNAVKNRYLLLLKNECGLGLWRDGLRIGFYDLKIVVYLLLFERSSLKAFILLREQWKRALHWRKEIQKRAKVLPLEQVGWFRDH